MSARRALLVGWLMLLGTTPVFGQEEEKPLKIFGYFQNAFSYENYVESDVFSNNSTFAAQQLNAFFQKDFSPHWTALVNFEVLNSFSTREQWGAFGLEEAWVKYRANKQLQVKAGLHVPVFNNLNEIKNRTPLLPYAIRPLPYETSFSDIIDIEAYLPQRAYAQVYGYLPIGEVKLDYGVYLGNGPNVRRGFEDGQSGTDSTTTFMIGGRVGIRTGDLKLGVSHTSDKSNFLLRDGGRFGLPTAMLRNVPRARLGADFSYYQNRIFFEAEAIRVYEDYQVDMDFDKRFAFATLGYQVTEDLLGYVSYWVMQEDVRLDAREIGKLFVPTVGVSYQLRDRIMLKAQYAYVTAKFDVQSEFGPASERNKFHYFATAVSVVF